jgi:small neutral amino acid transporter SnatA (MarC family)
MVPLRVLGAVFGVLQVALGIQIIASGLARSMAP